VKPQPLACHSFGALLALWCMMMSSCTWIFPARPAPPEAVFGRESSQDWGEDGQYCYYAFRDRVKDAASLPAFLALQDEGCQRADGKACIDRGRAHLGGCGGMEKASERGLALFLRACDMGQLDGCTGYVDSTPPKHWGLFANHDRNRASGRAVELAEASCLAGQVEPCSLLNRWHRARKFGLSPGKSDGAERLLAIGCFQGREPACRVLAARELSFGNREAATAVYALHCNPEKWGCQAISTLRERSSAVGDGRATAQLQALENALTRLDPCEESGPTVADAAAPGDEGVLSDQQRRCAAGDAASCEREASGNSGYDRSTLKLLSSACSSGRDDSCRAAFYYSLRIDDPVSAIGVGILHCRPTVDKWACSGLAAIVDPSPDHTALPVNVRGQLRRILCTLQGRDGCTGCEGAPS